jgi:hypothetical protein
MSAAATQGEGSVDVQPSQNGERQETGISNGTNSNALFSNPTGPGKRHEEYQYLDLVQEILDNGEHRPDR